MKLSLFSAFAVVVSMACSHAETAKPSPKAQPLPHGAVTLLDGPFKEHQELDRKVLLEMSPDRFLALFRKEAGLQPKAEPYGGWERQGVAGQTGGHYLTALCLMWRQTRDAEIKRRIDYMVDELAECQRANGGGYVAAIPGGRQIFDDVKAGKPLRGWVPWYTMHKLLAGLRDAALLAGNAKAQEVWIKLADFCCDTIAPLSEEQMQAMLKIEHGGMPEVMADLFAVTGNPKYLDAAKRFCHRAVLDPAAEGRDALDGLHANTQIPKFIGFMRIYELTGEEQYRRAARFFWESVTGRRTWVQGGNSDQEHFFPVARTAEHVESIATAETCNVYNMLRLARELYAWEPKAAYLDYCERALYNQILGGQEPKKGMFTYFQALKPGHFRIYTHPTDSGWCCLGTGMENPARYTESAYWSDARGITVGLYMASSAVFAEKGVTLRVETRFPEEPTAAVSIACAQPQAFALRLRAPGWLAAPMEVTLNGTRLDAKAQDGFVTVERTWKNGDTLSLKLPMSLRIEAAPQDPSHIAFLYGLVVLSGNWGTEGLDRVNFWQGGSSEKAYAFLSAPSIPPLVAETPEALLNRIAPVEGKPLHFALTTKELGRTVTLAPYSEMHFCRLVTYWRYRTPAAWEQERERFAAEEAALRELEARTVAVVRPGEQQDEVNFQFQNKDSRAGLGRDGRKWREATEWFSYELPIPPGKRLVLRATYRSNEENRDGRILVNGAEVARETAVVPEKTGRYIERDYPISGELIQGKSTLSVRFQAEPGSTTRGLYELRLLTEKP